MLRQETPVTAMPTGSVLQTAAFWEAARNLTSCARMTKKLEIDVPLMMTAILDVASSDFALLTSHATFKEPPMKTQPILLK